MVVSCYSAHYISAAVLASQSQYCKTQRTFTSHVNAAVELHSQDTALIRNHKSALFAWALKFCWVNISLVFCSNALFLSAYWTARTLSNSTKLNFWWVRPMVMGGWERDNYIEQKTLSMEKNMHQTSHFEILLFSWIQKLGDPPSRLKKVGWPSSQQRIKINDDRYQPLPYSFRKKNCVLKGWSFPHFFFFFKFRH